MELRLLSPNDKIDILIREPDKESNLTVLYIGGMASHLLSPVMVRKMFEQIDFTRFAQLRMRSHPFFGFRVLIDDMKDMTDALNEIKKVYGGKVILVGHSQGCRSIMNFLNSKSFAEDATLYDIISTCVMVGPVSIRNYWDAKDPEIKSKVEQSQKNPDSVQIFGKCGIRGERFLSIYSGPENMFSGDLTPEHFEHLNKVQKKIIFVLMESDEYAVVPNDEALLSVPNSTVKKIEGDHFLKSGVEGLVKIIREECEVLKK